MITKDTYSLDQKKKIHPNSVSMQIRSNFHNLCKFIHCNMIFHYNGVFIDTFKREHIFWIKRFVLLSSVYMQIRPNLHNLFKCIIGIV